MNNLEKELEIYDKLKDIKGLTEEEVFDLIELGKYTLTYFAGYNTSIKNKLVKKVGIKNLSNYIHGEI